MRITLPYYVAHPFSVGAILSPQEAKDGSKEKKKTFDNTVIRGKKS